jgi:hypothetical protein
MYYFFIWNPDISFGMVITLLVSRLWIRGSVHFRGEMFLLHGIQTFSGCHTALYPLSLEIKRRLRKTNHSISSGAEVKKSWRCTFTSPYLSIDIDIFVNHNWVDTLWQ